MSDNADTAPFGAKDYDVVDRPVGFWYEDD
jgi:hypothetical protein